MKQSKVKPMFLVLAMLMVAVSTLKAQANVECDSQAAPSPTFQTALSNLNSFHYARRSLAKAKSNLKDPKVCISMVALDKNAYQYFKYFIRIEVTDSASQNAVYRFHYIFQDASVQAFHNVGGQPWDGLDRQVAEEVIYNFVGKNPMTPQKTKFTGDVLEQFKMTATYLGQKSVIDPETLSSMRLVVDRQMKSYFLISWMTKSGKNPFSDKPISGGVIVVVDQQNNWMMASNIDPYNDLLAPLQKHLDQLQDSVGPSAGWTDKMFEFSQTN